MDSIIFDSSELSISLSKRVTLLDNMSATGKSYFPYATRHIAGRPRIVVYSNDVDYEQLKQTGFNLGNDVIYFLDRYDMFEDKILDDLLRKEDNKCILLDLKSSGKLQYSGIKLDTATIERPNPRRFIVKNGFVR